MFQLLHINDGNGYGLVSHMACSVIWLQAAKADNYIMTRSVHIGQSTPVPY